MGFVEDMGNQMIVASYSSQWSSAEILLYKYAD